MAIEIGKPQKQPQGYEAFIPAPFPPAGGFSLSLSLINKASEAMRMLGKLDGITQLLPDIDFFLFMYLRKDAASSSQIEGTKATMIDAIEVESKTSDDVPDDTEDIVKYLHAMNYGFKRLETLPLSLRFLRELHKELMEDARATQFSDPGNFRKSQNWIGGTAPSNAHFVPPPVDEMHQALDDLEKFLHQKDDTLLPVLKAGLAHSQFETIHPFLDGNGRAGRMLITFSFHASQLLERPVLFLSWYFKKHQKAYYQRLNEYHEGDVEVWLDFFTDGVIEVAKDAIGTVKQITALREEDMRKIQALSSRASESAMKVLPQLFGLPIVNVATIQKWTGFSRPGAQDVIDRFIEMGILKQKDESKTYGRSFMYHKYIDIFNV